MSGSKHWNGVQIWLVVACLMIVVEYSTCSLLDEMDLMRYRNAEKKGLNCRQCSVNKEYLISHMDTCKNICTMPMGKREFKSEEVQDSNIDKKPSVKKSSQCVIDPLYSALSEEGKKRVMEVLSEWL